MTSNDHCFFLHSHSLRRNATPKLKIKHVVLHRLREKKYRFFMLQVKIYYHNTLGVATGDTMSVRTSYAHTIPLTLEYQVSRPPGLSFHLLLVATRNRALCIVSCQGRGASQLSFLELYPIHRDNRY